MEQYFIQNHKECTYMIRDSRKPGHTYNVVFMKLHKELIS